MRPGCTSDALIIGGGPAGSTAAIALARAGFDVLLLERGTHPRFHVGESFLPRNMTIIEELGLGERLAALPRTRKLGAELGMGDARRPTTLFRFTQQLGPGRDDTFNIERAPFDAMLFEAAREAGARVRERAQVKRIARLAEGDVAVELADGSTCEARVLIDASGQSTMVGRHLGTRRVEPRLRKIAYFGHFQNVKRLEGDEAGYPTLVACREGWFWIIPLDERKTSMGLVLDADAARQIDVPPSQMLRWAIPRCPLMMDRAAEAVYPESNGVTADFSYRCEPAAGPGYFLIGDAAAFIDPVFSTGVCLGMMHALEASRGIEAILRGGADPRRVRRRYIASLRPPAAIFFWLVHGWYDHAFRELLLEGRGPLGVHRAIIALLAGQVFPRPSWSLRWRLSLFSLLVRVQRIVPLAPRREEFSLMESADADADADAGAGAGTGADAGADGDAGADAGTGADAGADADAGTGATGRPGAAADSLRRGAHQSEEPAGWPVRALKLVTDPNEAPSPSHPHLIRAQTHVRPMTLRLLHAFDRLAAEAPRAVAIRQVAPACVHFETLDRARLHASVGAVAHHLAARAAPGSVVMIAAPNRPEVTVAFLAALRAGMTVFPVHPNLAAPELRSAADRTSARVLIGGAEAIEALTGRAIERLDIAALLHLPPAPAGAASPPCDVEPALLLQSSGTTGAPKIVRRTGRSLDAVAANVRDAVGLGPADRVLAAIPLCHSYGVENALLAPLLAGAAVHLCDGFDPATICGQLATAEITVFPGVPFMFEVLAGRCTAAPHLRRAYSAGGPLPQSIFDDFLRRTGVAIGQLYGSTEVGSVTFNDPDDAELDPASAGVPMRDVRIAVLDPERPDVAAPLPAGVEGHVAIAAPSMLERYVDDQGDALVDGWFLTGDLGRLDRRGRLTITGRVKLQIDVGGIKVNPLEVEQVILGHPAVRECVVVAMPVTAALDRLRCVLALHDGAGQLDSDELRRFVRARLAPHKVPRVFDVRPSLPCSATGKVLREQVREDPVRTPRRQGAKTQREADQ